jgi:hypothetical protein
VTVEGLMLAACLLSLLVFIGAFVILLAVDGDTGKRVAGIIAGAAATLTLALATIGNIIWGG